MNRRKSTKVIILIISKASIIIVKVDIGEENENEVGSDETEEEMFTVENPSLDLEVIFIYLCIVT